MDTVREILQAKGSDIWSVAPDTTVYEALQLMADKDIGALLVLKNGHLVGIFSERDYARKVILHGKTSRETRVSEIMSSKVYFVGPDTTVAECMGIMTEKHIRHLPVFANNDLVGMISIGDVVKSIISEQEFVIGQLERYITGGR